MIVVNIRDAALHLVGSVLVDPGLLKHDHVVFDIGPDEPGSWPPPDHHSLTLKLMTLSNGEVALQQGSASVETLRRIESFWEGP